MMGLKQNMKNTYSIAKNLHYENRSHTPRLDRIENKVDLLTTKVDQLLMFHIGVTKHGNCQTFPLRDKEGLEDFMDRSHPDFDKRMNDFNNLMLLTVTNDLQKFIAALMENFFSREFASTYKWPPPG